MLIFLDIDGVMVPEKSWKTPEVLEDGFPAFSARAADTLRRLIAEKSTIMLTTSHRNNYTIEQWKRIFGRRAVLISDLKILPDKADAASRKEEILNWLRVHPVNETFLIIDDDKSLNDLPAKWKRFLIQPTAQVGLTQRDLEAAGI